MSLSNIQAEITLIDHNKGIVCAYPSGDNRIRPEDKIEVPLSECRGFTPHVSHDLVFLHEVEKIDGRTWRAAFATLNEIKSRLEIAV